MFDQLGPKDDFPRADELVELSSGERLHYFQTDGWPIIGGSKPDHIMVAGVCSQDGPEMLYKATSVTDRRKVARQNAIGENTWVVWYWLPVKAKSQSPEVVGT